MMKKIFMLVALLAFMVTGAYADETTFSMESKWAAISGDAGWEKTQDGITVTFSNLTGKGSTQTGFMKFVKGETMTIDAGSARMTNIVITASAADKTSKAGAVSVDKGTINHTAGNVTTTWEGEESKIVITNSDKGGDWRIASIKITFTTAPTVAVDPVFSLTKETIYLGKETSQIVVNNKGGLDGLTLKDAKYDHTIIEIDETGMITPVATGESSIMFWTDPVEGRYNAGEGYLTIKVIDFAKNELATISAETTWDWSGFATDLQLYGPDEEGGPSVPARDEDYTIADIALLNGHTLPDGFDGTTISFAGQYPYRKQAAQNGVLTIQPTVDGLLEVTFADTGSSVSATAKPRFLVINGEMTEFSVCRPTTGSEKSNDKKTVTVNGIKAGKVTIEGKYRDEDVELKEGETVKNLNAAICVYKVVFKPASTGIIENVKDAGRTSGARYNLAGQKVANGYKGIIIADGKKVMMK